MLLSKSDSQIAALIEREYKRQLEGAELIASENFASQSVMDAQGSILTNKYAEGLPRKRYYGGCKFVDEVEQLAICLEQSGRMFNLTLGHRQIQQ